MHCLAITHVSCTPCKAHHGGLPSAWSCIPVRQRQWGFLVPFKGCKSQLARDNDTRVTTPAVEKHNPFVPCRITEWSEGDSYLRIIWDLDPRLRLWWNRRATHLQPGPVVRMIYIGSKNRRIAKTMGSAHIVVPLFQTDLCSLGKPIQRCQILERLVSSAATNVFIFCAQLQSRIPLIPLVFRFQLWDNMGYFIEVYWMFTQGSTVNRQWNSLWKLTKIYTTVRNLRTLGKAYSKCCHCLKPVMFMLDHKMVPKMPKSLVQFRGSTFTDKICIFK